MNVQIYVGLRMRACNVELETMYATPNIYINIYINYGPVVHFIFALFLFLFLFLFSPLVSLLFSFLLSFLLYSLFSLCFSSILSYISTSLLFSRFSSILSLSFLLSALFFPSLVPESLSAALTRGKRGCGLYNGFMCMRAIVLPHILLHSATDYAMEHLRINEASFQLESAYNCSKTSFLHEAKAILTTLDSAGSSNGGGE